MGEKARVLNTKVNMTEQMKKSRSSKYQAYNSQTNGEKAGVLNIKLKTAKKNGKKAWVPNTKQIMGK